MGLSFNGTADARAFDRGIRIALENLEKGNLERLILGLLMRLWFVNGLMLQ